MIANMISFGQFQRHLKMCMKFYRIFPKAVKGHDYICFDSTSFNIDI